MNKMKWNIILFEMKIVFYHSFWIPFNPLNLHYPNRLLWKAEKVLGWTPKDEFGGDENFKWEACWTVYPSTSYGGYDENVKAKCIFRSVLSKVWPP